MAKRKATTDEAELRELERLAAAAEEAIAQLRLRLARANERALGKAPG